MTRSDEFRTARRRYLLVAALAPALVTLAGVALMLAWLPEVPSTIATHWSGDGSPDAFAPAWTVPLGAALLGFGLTALFVGFMFAGTRDGRWGPMMRLLGAFSLGTTVLLVVLLTWSLGMQRGLDDPADAPGIGIPLLVSAGLAVLSGLAAWFAQPRTTIAGAHASTTVAPLELGPEDPRHSQSHATLFEDVDGVTNHQVALRLALGRDPRFPKGAGPFAVAAKCFVRSFSDGVVRRLPEQTEIDAIEAAVPGVSVAVVVRVGDRLSELRGQDSYSYELARVYIGASDEAELTAKFDEVEAALPFEIEPIP